MTVSRHISIDDVHIGMMKPYVEKHSGNFGAALREIINNAGKYDSRSNLSAVESSLFKWIMTEIDGILVPDSVLDEFINPTLIRSMSELEEFLINRFNEFDWDIDLLLKSDNDSYPSRVLIEIKGDDQKIKLVAQILSQYLVKNSLDHAPLEIKYLSNSINSIKINLSISDRESATRSLNTFFGGMDEVIKVIKSRPSFWKSVINEHLLSNYNMVTVHRNCLEDLFADKIPTEETTIENLAKKPIHEIPLKEMLHFIKEVYETSRIVDRVDIDRESITLFHNFRNKKALDTLKKSLITLLEANGRIYNSKSIADTIVLIHRPDVGIKINEIVDKLRTSDSRFDQELLMFITFLNGLKEVPDIPLSLTVLGRRIGRSLMLEYERENNIKTWDLGIFQKAFGTIDSKLNREAECRLEGNNLIYTIKRCNFTNGGTAFDTYICRTARETFKGAMNYALGDRAKLEIKKLLSHGDNFCEVVIRME